MPIDILMPALSPTMTEGTLAKWHKKEGDTVAAGDVIAEIETDKATMEVEAVDEGKIGKILVKEGTAGVAVNTPIAVLLEEGEKTDAIQSKANVDVKPEAPKKAEAAKDSGAPKAAAAAAQPAKASAHNTGDRVFASPLAKRIAAEKGIDLNSVSGSGPHGRIVRADLDGAPAGKAAPKAAVAPAQRAPATSSGPDAKQLADLLGQKYRAVPNNSIRKVVAKRLLESKQTVPHFYLTVEYRIDDLLAARAELNDAGKDKYKLSVNDFVIKAAAMALKAYPNANAAWTDDAILLYENADISIAVATPNGLMTPIVKAAETKGLVQISGEVKDLAKRAREGKLKPEEFQGGSFTVSNLGMYGISSFGAIINPPQACILAVGAGVQKPYVENGEVRIGTFMNCTLSVDHRAVDGAVGAEYLQILKQFIETPAAMLL
jgi:pyruvate dehydrogenase E2 component (dihydrolipoamide acetyltransferase)